MKYIDKETGEKVSLTEIEKIYKEIKSNIDFVTLNICDWNTLEVFIAECYCKKP